MNSVENSTLVMKFGGAALRDSEGFYHVADIIGSKVGKYQHILVVVSAMEKMTDRLIALAEEISPHPPKREKDMLLSVGERISMALLAMALKERGHQVVSLTGSQSGIITSSDHLEARIVDVKPYRILNHLQKGQIVIVAGFQGVSVDKEITTLGRGGSDTSAVALAVALRAEKVEFYKDVPGVYSEDPKKDLQAVLFSHLRFSEAIVLAQRDSFVVHPRAILLASKNWLPLHVLTFRKELYLHCCGTQIGGKEKIENHYPVYEDSKEEKVLN